MAQIYWLRQRQIPCRWRLAAWTIARRMQVRTFPEADLGKLKTIFWRHNIVGFAPILEVPVEVWSPASKNWSSPGIVSTSTLIGTWAEQSVSIPDGTSYITGMEKTNPWWNVSGKLVCPKTLKNVWWDGFCEEIRRKGQATP